jgi:hypothetical protein
MISSEADRWLFILLTFLFIILQCLQVALPLVEQELHSLPEHLSSPPVFSGVRVTQSLVLYAITNTRWIWKVWRYLRGYQNM